MLQIRTRQASGRVLITTERPSAPALTASATPHEPSSALPALDVRTSRVSSPRNITPRHVNRRPRSPDIVPSSAGTVSPFAGWDEVGKAIETVAYNAGAERAAARFAERAAAARGSSLRAGSGSRRSAAVRTLKLFVCGVEHSVLGHVLAALDLASSVAVVDRLQVRILVIESQSAVSIQFQCSTSRTGDASKATALPQTRMRTCAHSGNTCALAASQCRCSRSHRHRRQGVRVLQTRPCEHGNCGGVNSVPEPCACACEHLHTPCCDMNPVQSINWQN